MQLVKEVISMSRENAKRFYDLVKLNERLAWELAKVKAEIAHGNEKFLKDDYVIKEKIIPLAQEQGLEFTADEFISYSEELLPKLSADELAEISGGVININKSLASVFAFLSLAAPVAGGLSHSAFAMDPEPGTSQANPATGSEEEDLEPSSSATDVALQEANRLINERDGLRYENSRLSDMVRELTQELAAKTEQLGNANSDIETLKSRLAEATVDHGEYVQYKDGFYSQQEKIKELQDRMQTELAAKNEQLNKANSDIEVLRSTLSNSKEKSEDISKKLRQVQEEYIGKEKSLIDELQAKDKQLEEMQQRMQVELRTRDQQMEEMRKEMESLKEIADFKQKHGELYEKIKIGTHKQRFDEIMQQYEDSKIGLEAVRDEYNKNMLKNEHNLSLLLSDVESNTNELKEKEKHFREMEEVLHKTQQELQATRQELEKNKELLDKELYFNENYSESLDALTGTRGDVHEKLRTTLRQNKKLMEGQRTSEKEKAKLLKEIEKLRQELEITQMKMRSEKPEKKGFGSLFGKK